MARTVKSDEEVGFIDDIPVLYADGHQGHVSDFESEDEGTEEVEVAVPKATPKQSPKAGTKKAAATSRATKLQQRAQANAEKAREQAKQQALATKVNAITLQIKGIDKTFKAPKGFTLEQARQALTQARADQKAAATADRIAKRAQAKLDAEQAKKDRAAQREADKKAAAEARAQNAAEREARKLAKQGLTGDPDKDAEFLAVVEESKALTITEQPTVKDNALSLRFLETPGVKLSTVGIQLPEELGLHQWAITLAGLVGMQEVSWFAIGDALIYGEEHYGNQYDHVTKALGLARSTVKNYKYVAAEWKLDERVEGLGFKAHLLATALHKINPARARNILEQAAYEKLGTGWIEEQVNAERPEQERKQTHKQQVDALVQAGLVAQSEGEDIADAEERASKQRANVVALAEYAQANEVVPAKAVTTGIGILQARIAELEQENADLKSQLAQALAQINGRGEANARILAGDSEPLAETDGLAYLFGEGQESGEAEES